MNKDTQHLVKLVLVEGCVKKIADHNLCPSAGDLPHKIRREVQKMEEAMFTPWSDSKVVRCAREGDEFLANLYFSQPIEVTASTEKNAELYYSYVAILLVEDLQDFSRVRKLSKRLLDMLHQLRTHCRKKNYYYKVLEQADAVVHEIYAAIDAYKPEDLGVKIKTFSPSAPASKFLAGRSSFGIPAAISQASRSFDKVPQSSTIFGGVA